MKSTFFRILALVALIVGFSMGNAAYAKHDNETKFTGVIETLPNTAGFVGDWKVSGRTVHVTSSTPIEQTDGRVAVGATVKVEGTTRSDNSVDATGIEVRQGAPTGGGSGSGDDGSAQPTFKGTIEMLPTTSGFIGDWKVGGRTIHVSSSTRLESEIGPVAVGAFAEIQGTVRADGSMDAAKIEIKSNVAGGDGHDELNGTIESLPNPPGLIGDWRVSGRTVHVTLATVIDREHGAPVVGALVEVNGTMRADGSLDADKIEVKSNIAGADDPNELNGTIESLPNTAGFVGDWRVSGRTVHVTAATLIDQEHGAPVVGALVEVKGTVRADGSIDATRIEVKSSSSGPGGSNSEGQSASLKGTIQNVPSGATLIGEWLINNQVVHVTSSTKLNAEHGAFAVGTRVKVKGLMLADGSIVATKIQVRD